MSLRYVSSDFFSSHVTVAMIDSSLARIMLPAIRYLTFSLKTLSINDRIQTVMPLWTFLRMFYIVLATVLPQDIMHFDEIS